MSEATGRRAGLLVAVATALTLGALAFVAWGPFPVGADDWQWFRVARPAWDAAAPALVVWAAIGFLVFAGRREAAKASRLWQGLLLASIVVLAFIAQLAAARQLPGGYTESIIALGKPGANRYHQAAREIGRLGPVLRDYPQWMRGPHKLIVTHPAGPLTLFWSLNHVFAGHEQAAKRFVGWCEDVLASGVHVKAPEEASGELFRTMSYADLAGAWLASFVLRLVAALAALPAYAMARRLYGREAAFTAAGLVAATPSLLLFSPGLDQLFPAIAATACWLGWTAGERRSVGRAGLTGLAISAGLFFSLSFVVVAGWAALLAVAGLSRGAARPSGRDLAKLLAGGCVGLLVPAAALYLALGYDSFAVWRQCVAANAKFNAQSGRAYWTWALIDPVEYLVFLGIPAACLLVSRVASEVGRLPRRWVREADWPSLIVAGLLVVLNVAGVNRGEVGRLWMFLMPACAVAAAHEVERAAPFRRIVFASLFALQVLQVTVFRALLDVLLGMYRGLGG